MIRNIAYPTLALSLVACGGTGTWEAETYGEPYIEEEIPAADFEDGCNAAFSFFEVTITEAALVDSDGTDQASMDASATIDVSQAGPHALVTLDAPATHFDEARFRIAPDGGPSVHAMGTLTCAGTTVDFDWSFETDTTYHCEPEDLTIPAGGTASTQLTVHGDHFFYDGLANDDAVVRGMALVDADADADGTLTLAELEAVPVAPLGYQVGPYSDVTDLRAFVTHLTQTLGHVDGEGHCQVDL